MSYSGAQRKEAQSIVSRAITEALSEGNYDVMAELYADDFVQQAGPRGDITSRDDLQAWFEDVHAAFPDFEAVEEFSIADDDLVASRLTYTGTHEGEFLGIPGTGKHVEITGNTFNRIQDGRIVETWAETDFMTLLQQVGVLEDGPN
jgi:steroid delta-isomerase-like uncharacterized protein